MMSATSGLATEIRVMAKGSRKTLDCPAFNRKLWVISWSRIFPKGSTALSGTLRKPRNTGVKKIARRIFQTSPPAEGPRFFLLIIIFSSPSCDLPS